MVQTHSYDRLSDSEKCSGLKSFDDAIDESSPYLRPSENCHYPCLDMVRILCVFLACVDHGGTSYGVWNTMFVQSWVLQYLYYVCGFCFAMSSRGVFAYNRKLAVYFAVGVIVNISAWQIAGLNWRGDIFGAIFQFWFVFGLMVFLFVLNPLKKYLQGLRQAKPCLDERSAWQDCGKCFATIVVGCMLIKLFFEYVLTPIAIWALAPTLQPMLNGLGSASRFWGVSAKGDDATSAFLQQFFSDSELSVSNVFIAVVFPMVSSRLPFSLWIILLNTYLHKCVLYRSQTCRLLNAFDATLMGVVFFYCGFAGRRVIGEYLTRYWFFFLFACNVLWQPGTIGRFDESPSNDLGFRITYNLLEACFALLFFTAIERLVDPKIFSNDRLHFLCHWSLLLFLVHKFVFILITKDNRQLGVREYWLFMFLLVAICWVVVGRQGKVKEGAESKHWIVEP